MTTLIRPCPFCGRFGCYVNENGIAVREPTDNVSCVDDRCMGFASVVSVKSWQSRPLEDALLSAAKAALIVLENFTLDTENGNTYQGIDEGVVMGEKMQDEVITQLRSAIAQAEPDKAKGGEG